MTSPEVLGADSAGSKNSRQPLTATPVIMRSSVALLKSLWVQLTSPLSTSSCSSDGVAKILKHRWPQYQWAWSLVVDISILIRDKVARGLPRKKRGVWWPPLLVL